MDAVAQLLDVFLHLDAHLAEWAGVLGPWLYVLLFLIVFCETGLVVTPFLPGDSLLFALGLLAGQAESPRTQQDYLAWEVFGNRAVRQGDWKLRWQYKPLGKENWELFNLAADPAERKDLAAEHPDKLKAMAGLWDHYVQANNVILPSRGPYDTVEKDMPQRVTVVPGFPPLFSQKQFVPPKDMLAEPKE